MKLIIKILIIFIGLGLSMSMTKSFYSEKFAMEQEQDSEKNDDDSDNDTFKIEDFLVENHLFHEIQMPQRVENLISIHFYSYFWTNHYPTIQSPPPDFYC